MTERIIPIKIRGHWEDARVHVQRGDLFIDIPAELIRLVEADHPGSGARHGYQLLIERIRIAEFFRDDLHWLDKSRKATRASLRQRLSYRIRHGAWRRGG